MLNAEVELFQAAVNALLNLSMSHDLETKYSARYRQTYIGNSYGCSTVDREREKSRNVYMAGWSWASMRISRMRKRNTKRGREINRETTLRSHASSYRTFASGSRLFLISIWTFAPKVSCLQLFLCTLDKIVSAFDKRNEVHASFLDISKAFIWEDHVGLLLCTLSAVDRDRGVSLVWKLLQNQ